MPTFSNLKDLEKYMNQQAKKAMSKGKNVKRAVVDEMIEKIDKNIYPKYDPKMYTRQTTDGGLTDPENFAMDETAEGVSIYSTREATDRSGQDVYALEIIEGHKEYSIEDTYGYGYEKPRHAVEPTREALRNSNKLTNAMKDDLKSVGLNIK
ncbi:hypothetical protein BAOM_3122 [Peribacillus asahii]|uniref:HK97 gp10 family phage protein n=1 Tax=Peribacillus asahii TaxID=228899 RepID=A0A3Q9RNQ2_9BACI|nr:hypothetical protein [Peribacillus asahii]AZV43731.1 hypothetical protein BAOM_3122 [Peribacillus asahii]